MSPLLIGISAAAGLAAGALVPLPAYRLSVPAGEPNRRSCSSCREPLPSGVAGWIGLPARCTACRTRLGPAVWLTAGAGAIAAGLVAAALGDNPALPVFVAAAIVGVLLGAIDMSCKRLPHALVIPAICFTPLLLGIVALGSGAWSAWLRSLAAGFVLGAVYLLLYLLPGRGLGFGDVTLAVLLGLYLGWLGWGVVLLGGMLPWLVHGPVVVGLLIAGRIGRKSLLPFGPAMLAGALLSVVGIAWLQALAH